MFFEIDIEEIMKKHLSEEQYDVVCDLANFYNSRHNDIKSVTFGYQRPWTRCFASFWLESRRVLFVFDENVVSRDFEETFLYKINKAVKTKLFSDNLTEEKEFTEFPDN